MKRDSYMGKLLFVDLTEQTSRQVSVPRWLREELVGGKGWGAKLLADLLPPGGDPLGPENPLLFLTGPLTGTPAPAMRACVVTKSPLTGLFLDSYFGGHFGPEIKYCGYDGLVITGAAPEPVWLQIEDDTVRFHPAGELWGEDTFATNARIKEEAGDPGVRVACIGPAGENGVLFALISLEYNRQAGRGGSGAVMGAKNLKAISLRGTRTVAARDPASFSRAVRQAYSELEASEAVQALTAVGTLGTLAFSNEVGILPTSNFRAGIFDRARDIGEEGQSDRLWLRNTACTGCPIACTKVGKVRSGPYRGTPTDIEYEVTALLGSNLEIGDPRELGYLVQRCDALGLDGMSAGGVLAYAMEAAEKGLVNYDGQATPKFGDVTSAAAVLEDLVWGRGEVARVLAGGVKRAAQRFPGTGALAQDIKALEMPGFDPRGAPGVALAFMTADRGGCHQRALPLDYEFGDEPFRGRQLGHLQREGKGALVAYLQDYLAGLDTLVKCDFGQFGISPATYAQMYNAATGGEWNQESIWEMGERVWNLVRRFNLREGLDPAEDTLPRRFLTEALPNGTAAGHYYTPDDLKVLLQEYYRERGWSRDGRPEEETGRRLGLERLPAFTPEEVSDGDAPAGAGGKA